MAYFANPSVFSILAALALFGCNSARTPTVVSSAAPAAAAVEAKSDFAVPQGSGCSGALARYRAVLDNDLAMGHVNRSVYDRIQGELGEAASACSAGREAQALSLVRASKARHGYPG